jgi:iron complex outermembrane receptor protein
MGVGGSCPPNHVFRGRCRFDYTSTIQILPQSERENLIGSFSKKLNQDHTFTADVVYSKFNLTSRIAPPPVDMQIPTGSGLYNTYIGNPALAGAGVIPGDDLYAYWRGVDVGNRTTNDETQAWHLNLGLTGLIAGWDYAAGYTHSTNTWIETFQSGWLKNNETQAAIVAGSFDPFLAPGLQTAAGTAALANMQYRGEYKRETSTLDVLNLKGARDAFKIGDLMAQFGAGIDYRREQVKYSPSAIAQGVGNTIAGDSGAEVPFNVSRNSYGLFAELVTPFSKNFDVTTSVRHDHYADFGNTDNYKVAARFQPTKTVLLRGSVGSGFRAPSVPMVGASKQLYGVTGGTYSCPAAALAAAQAVDPTASCHVDGSQYEQFAAGNKNLKPEKSQQWTLGFRVEPVTWASFGADWWNVHVKERIGQLSEDVVMRDPASYLKNFTIFNDPGTGKHYVSLFLPNENLGEEKYSGIDLDGKLQGNTGIGTLSANLHWTRMLKNDYQRLPGGPWFSNLGKYNDDSVTFKDIYRLVLALNTNSWQHSLTMNYKSGYDDYQCSAADCSLVRAVTATGAIGGVVDMMDHKVKSWTTFDWQTQYLFNKSLTLTGGVRNLTNQDPPLSIRVSGPHQLGYDPRYADPFLRTFYLNAKYVF